MPKKKLYIGCALSGLSTNLRRKCLKEVEKLEKILSGRFEILSFLGPTAGTAADVYLMDIQKCIGTTDFFLALCDYPSTGLGYEIGTAVEKRGIPVLVVARKGLKVSRIITGVQDEKYRFAWYDSIEGVAEMAIEFFLEEKSQ